MEMRVWGWEVGGGGWGVVVEGGGSRMERFDYPDVYHGGIDFGNSSFL